ncbi:unnamed protein product [Cylicostephanus goldi]|uniref:Uncharacterized protein n=1 Tax=Cylicostephanus goldi TaxID=71465 RepID=A0A3P6RQJ0_CYLGO|nr:unnamed protein product [Cylicostephanus goldi]
MFIVGTADTIEFLKWFVLCSLEKHCIAPPGAKSSCEFGIDRYNEYAKCHRFDQSIVNLLLANAYECNASNYKSYSLGNGARLLREGDLILKKVKLECSHRW